MQAHRLTIRCGVLAAALAVLASSPLARAQERERNAWPVVVEQADEQDRPIQWTSAGPLLFGRMVPDGNGTMSGLRPIWVQRRDAKGDLRAGYFLYPLFSYHADENTYRWSIFELVRRTNRRTEAGGRTDGTQPGGDFEIWPFWFSRQTGDPEMDYRALFPVAGTIKNKLGIEQATWVGFPLYVQTQKRGAVTTMTPWPIVRVTRGTAQGFGLWPLFETREQPGRWRRETYLWPLGYNNTVQPPADAPAGTPPTRQVGALPLYARHTGPGVRDETFLWPFFGYTDRTAPFRYQETRYLWPFLVQGRGDRKYVNRWGPIYTHSVVKGYDKTWYVWPLVRHAKWQDQRLAREKTQVLFFLYWSEQQRSLANPAAPEASLTHLWPLASTWDNGAGRKQFQLFSPLDVFFPNNEKVRAAWSPLFAIARHEQMAPGTTRTSLLWNAVTWRRDDARHEREFHLGPLFSASSRADAKRYALGNGLIALRREPATGHWRLRWFDFSKRSPNAAKPSR